MRLIFQSWLSFNFSFHITLIGIPISRPFSQSRPSKLFFIFIFSNNSLHCAKNALKREKFLKNQIPSIFRQPPMPLEFRSLFRNWAFQRHRTRGSSQSLPMAFTSSPIVRAAIHRGSRTWVEGTWLQVSV